MKYAIAVVGFALLYSIVCVQTATAAAIPLPIEKPILSTNPPNNIQANTGFPIPPVKPKNTTIVAVNPPPSNAAAPNSNFALSSEDTALYREAFTRADQGDWSRAHSLADRATDTTLKDVLLWQDLQAPSERRSFQSLGAFLLKHPNWPEQDTLIAQAEFLMPSDLPTDIALRWFENFPPQTAKGIIRNAAALEQTGQSEASSTLVRNFWHTENMTADEEKQILKAYSPVLSRQDHEIRLDTMIWSNNFTAAKRIIPKVSDGWKKLAMARIALSRGDSDAQYYLNHVPPELKSHAGLIFERVHWRREQDLTDSAIELLGRDLTQKAIAATPEDSQGRWWKEQHILARRLIERGDKKQAYDVVKLHGQPFGSKEYAEAEWLAGWLALRAKFEPDTAIVHFNNMYNNVKSPISLARGAYWLGRAFEAKVDMPESESWYAKAAIWPNTFYGQLAALKQTPSNRPKVGNDPTPLETERVSFDARGDVRIIAQLGSIGQYGLQKRFVENTEKTLNTATEYLLLDEVVNTKRNPELAVWLGKQASQKGILIYRPTYPVVDYGSYLTGSPALAQAIIRQESLFNPDALSPAGARGLMQLMPATAAELAKKLGVSTGGNIERLTLDPNRNVQLGSAYINKLTNQFDGSLVMAVASYNAGQGRVRGWIKTFGDPRTDHLALIDWIESLPVYETRNYVQRVMENYHVYQAMMGSGEIEVALR